MSSQPNINDIRRAHARIGDYIHCTPVLTCEGLDRTVGAKLFFKCENFQKAGAFKFRGALNAVMSLPASDSDQTVITHSSGNHGAALSLAARMRGIKALIVMPFNASSFKRRAVTAYGGNIISCEPTLSAREATTGQLIDETGALLIHPYNDVRVIAGQGTTALELLAQAPELDVVIAPVGGGGLLSGTAIATADVSPGTQIIGAQAEQADNAYRSFRAGKILPTNQPDTIADGLRASVGSLTFPIIRRHVDEIVTVTEQSIVDAMRQIFERMKIVIEPSAAVAVAAIMEYPKLFMEKNVGVILSGGNVELQKHTSTIKH